MYHHPNHPFSHNHKEHSNLFSSTQDINLLTNQSAVTSLPVVSANLEPQTADTSGSQAVRQRKEKGAKTKSVGKVVDTSQFTVEQRVVAAVWVHERLHTRTSMGQIKQQFLARFGRPAPATNTLLAWARKLFSAGAVHDAPRAGRPARRIKYRDSTRPPQPYLARDVNYHTYELSMNFKVTSSLSPCEIESRRACVTSWGAFLFLSQLFYSHKRAVLVPSWSLCHWRASLTWLWMSASVACVQAAAGGRGARVAGGGAGAVAARARRRAARAALHAARAAAHRDAPCSEEDAGRRRHHRARAATLNYPPRPTCRPGLAAQARE